MRLHLFLQLRRKFVPLSSPMNPPASILPFDSIANCSNVGPGILKGPDHRFDGNLPIVIAYLVDLLGPSEPASDLDHA